MSTRNILIAEFLRRLSHAKTKRDQWREICNPQGKRLLDHTINSLCHDLQQLGAGEQARRIVEG